MARFRDFDSTSTETAEAPPEPIEFKLAGQTFTCVGEAPAGVLLDFMASATDTIVDGKIVRSRSSEALLSFMHGVLVDEDIERWDALIRDKTTRITIDKIGEIVEYVAEELTNRPTQQPSA